MSHDSTIKSAVALVLLMILSATGNAQSEPYAVVQQFTLQRAANGLDGSLQLLLDSRLTEPIRKQMWRMGEWDLVLDANSEAYQQFKSKPPLNAKLVIRDTQGTLVAEKTLEKPMAKISLWRAPAVKLQLFLVTEDYSIGMGSYAGPITMLLQVKGASFYYPKVLDKNSHKDDPIRFMSSLKTAWHIRRLSHGVEILEFACRPDWDGKFTKDPNDGDAFILIYTRYSYDGKQWSVHRKTEKGFWEYDEPFPARRKFQ